MQDALPGLSAYHQTYGNPVAFADPLGLWPEPGLNRNIGESAGEQWMREHGMGAGYTNPVFAQGPSYQQQQFNNIFSAMQQGNFNINTDSDDPEVFRTFGVRKTNIYYQSYFGNGDPLDPYQSQIGVNSYYDLRGGSANFSYTNGFGLAGAGLGFVENYYRPGNYWRGMNGKLNRIGWGGNQYTGARSSSLSRAGAFRVVGRAFALGSVGYDVLRLQQGKIGGGELAVNTTMTGIGTFGGVPGFVLSASYFIMSNVVSPSDIANMQRNYWQRRNNGRGVRKMPRTNLGNPKY